MGGFVELPRLGYPRPFCIMKKAERNWACPGSIGRLRFAVTRCFIAPAVGVRQSDCNMKIGGAGRPGVRQRYAFKVLDSHFLQDKSYPVFQFWPSSEYWPRMFIMPGETTCSVSRIFISPMGPLDSPRQVMPSVDEALA